MSNTQVEEEQHNRKARKPIQVNDRVYLDFSPTSKVGTVIEINRERLLTHMIRWDDGHESWCRESMLIPSRESHKGTERTYDWPKPIMRKGTGEGETLDVENVHVKLAQEFIDGIAVLRPYTRVTKLAKARLVALLGDVARKGDTR